MSDVLTMRVAARHAAELSVPKERRLEHAAMRVPAVRGALITDSGSPSVGVLSVTMDVVLKVTEATDVGPVKFQGSLPGISGALTRALKAVGASQVSVTPPEMVRGVGGTQYESDVMTVTFEVSDAPE